MESAVPVAADPKVLREVEVSITARCTLACKECGFLVPHQLPPAHGDPVVELGVQLSRLRDLGFRVGTLVVLGGEPTIDGALLERALLALHAVGIASAIEVVSNGLTPQGLTARSLSLIDRFTVSVYGYDDDLLDRWRRWLGTVAPGVELRLRRTDAWDQWTARHSVTPDEAQRMYEACWYRRHCITVERGRVFACSRIAKLGRDREGIELAGGATRDDVEAYLNAPRAFDSCADCTPMMNLATVPVGEQPDDRVARLQRRAIDWLDRAIAVATDGGGVA